MSVSKHTSIMEFAPLSVLQDTLVTLKASLAAVVVQSAWPAFPFSIARCVFLDFLYFPITMRLDHSAWLNALLAFGRILDSVFVAMVTARAVSEEVSTTA